MAVGFPLQTQTAMMAMMLAGQGNGALAMRNTGLRQAQCSTCQPDLSTGDHICDCQRWEAHLNQIYGSVAMQDVLQVAGPCDCPLCPLCPYAAYAGGTGGFLNGGLQIGGAVSPLAAGFGIGGGVPLNAALPMGSGLQTNALALQGASPLGVAGLGSVGGLGLGGLSGLSGGLSGGMMGSSFGANNSRMLSSFPMGGGLNRRGFSRGNPVKLGYSNHGRVGRAPHSLSSPWFGT